MEDDIRLIADELNSQVMEETLAYASFNQRPSVDPAVMITEDILEIAEETTAKEVLSCIHPTLDSDEKRKDVIEYVQSLIKTRVGLEVLYLPFIQLLHILLCQLVFNLSLLFYIYFMY